MARERKTNFAKVKVWTESVIADFSGTISGCVRQLIIGVPEDQQDALIETLRKDRIKRIERKAGA